MQSPLNRTDRRILTAALVLLLVSLYLMYDDSILFGEDIVVGKSAIGEIKSAEQDVRRKRSRQFAWKNAKSSDRLFSGDSVFTGQNSNVEIKFKDGRALTLSENSLVVFNNVGDQLNLNFQIQGCVIAEVNGKKTEVCGDNSTLELSSAGLDVVKGDAKPNKPLDEVTWLQTPPAKFYHWKKTQSMKMGWGTEGVFGRYRVQFSKNEKFDKVEFEETSLKKSFRTTSYPSRGRYFIRIEGQDLNGRAIAYSKPVSVEIAEALVPQITTPTLGQKFNFPRNADSELLVPNQIPVQWTYANSKMKFEVQISKDEEFAQVESSLAGEGLQIKTPALNPGKYFLRVRDTTLLSGGEQPWSEVRSFDVTFGDPQRLAAPVLINPKIAHRLPAEKDPVLKWEPVKNADQYVVEVSRTEDFANSTRFETAETNLLNQKLFPGKSYFRVTPVSPKGNLGDTSVGEIRVISNEPVLNPVETRVVLGKSPEDQGEPQDFPVSWSPVKVADSYLIEVSKDKDFTAPRKLQTREPTSVINVESPSEVFYRVRPLDIDGTPIAKFSQPGVLNYVLKVPLATPDLKEPFNQVTLFFQKTTDSIFWMEWESVRQADIYLLEVSPQPDFAQKVLTIQTKRPRYMVKETLPQGKLFWRVRALADSGRESEWSAPREMSVFSGRRPAAVKPKGTGGK